MEQEKQIVVVRPQMPTLQDWEIIKAVAPAFHIARWFGLNNPEQGMAIMLKGHELGVGLAASFEFIKPIEGKPCLVPMGALALIQNSPLIEGIKIEDLADKSGNPTGCKVWMKRVNGFEYTVTWTMEDAKRAGVVKAGSGWEKYPANMLRWRAIGFCADVVCPDVLGGLKRADELGADLMPNGDVLEGTWRAMSIAETPSAAPAPQAVEAPSVEPPRVTLDQLVQKHGAEAVIVANEGKIPGTDAEVAAVAAKLEVEAANA